MLISVCYHLLEMKFILSIRMRHIVVYDQTISTILFH